MDDQQQTPFPQPAHPASGPGLPRPHRRRRLAAGVAAVALVTGAAGVGGGYALGHDLQGGSTGGSRSAGTYGGPGIETVPGAGWGWSGGGAVPLPPRPFAGGSGSSGSQSGSADTTTRASGSQLTGLVRVSSTMKYAGAAAAATGMILTPAGEVVTNHHVVEGSTSVKVTVMSTGRTYAATVVGTDAKDDVAVLRMSGASGLNTVTPDTDGVSVGDKVTAVGDANGTVSSLSAASGRVLALGQSITTRSDGTATGERLHGMIQISSDVIAGDSGGATYDQDGRVVGMTTAASAGGTDVVGYAVPIATVLRVANDLEQQVPGPRYDYTRPAFLGVGLARTGDTVRGVFAGTPAATAGIRAGARINEIGGTPVATAAQLRKAVAARSPGDHVSVGWVDAGGSRHRATVTLVAGGVD